jgi:hypothetical protein
MQASYNCLANSARYQEGDEVLLYCITQTRGKSPKLQPSWEGTYKVVIQISDVVYRIQRLPVARMMVVHLHRFAPYLGAAQDLELELGSSVSLRLSSLYQNISCDSLEKLK